MPPLPTPPEHQIAWTPLRSTAYPTPQSQDNKFSACKTTLLLHDSAQPQVLEATCQAKLGFELDTPYPPRSTNLACSRFPFLRLSSSPGGTLWQRSSSETGSFDILTTSKLGFELSRSQWFSKGLRKVVDIEDSTPPREHH